VKTALGGWQVSGIVTMSSGLPINIGLSGNQSATASLLPRTGQT